MYHEIVQTVTYIYIYIYIHDHRTRGTSDDLTLPPSPMIFMFVVDTSMIEEMAFLKSALSQAIELLPDYSSAGLITFGTLVHVHELGFGEIPKTYISKGSKDQLSSRWAS